MVEHLARRGHESGIIAPGTWCLSDAMTRAGVEVAELAAGFSHQVPMLVEALGLGDDVDVNPSGGSLVADPMMVTGLTRIGRAYREISENGRSRTLGHASSGPALQQNLVCVMEGNS